MTYSLDFRIKVLSVKKKEQLSFMKAAQRFDVGVASVVRWSKRLVPQVTRNKPATKIDMSALKEDIKKHPDAYQYERAQRLGVSSSGIWKALKRLNVTYKKNPLAPKSGSRKTLCLLPNSCSLSPGE